MRGFSLGCAVGIITALVGCNPSRAQQPNLNPMLPPDAQEWEAAKPILQEPSHIQPPRGSFGVLGCGQYTIWVFLADGKSYRFDSGHRPKSEEEMQKLLAWLNTGPTDIVNITCGASV